MADGLAVGTGVSRRLAAHAASVRFEDLPAEAVAAAKRSLADAVGVTLAASGLGEGCEAFAEIARESAAEGPATVIGWGFRTSPLMAAFANGSMAHALDFEDTYDEAFMHPTAAVMPAAMAYAESAGGVAGKDLIAALAVGADVSVRVALAFTESPDKRGWYLMPMLGAFGAAAAAGRLAGLVEDQMLDALSLAMCQATLPGEFKRHAPSQLRAVRDAFSAKAGLSGALLAARGIHGFEKFLDGEAGLYALYAGGAYDADRLTAGLGRDFAGADVSTKPWPSCRGTHAFVEAALALLATHRIEPADIRGVHATVSPFFEVLCIPPEQKRRPETAIDAKFSIPFTVAAALGHKSLTLDHYSSAGLADKAVLDLAGRVTYEVEPAWTFRDSTRGARALEMNDGTRLEHAVEFPLGHPDNPMDDAAIAAKFFDCAGHARVAPSAETARGIVEQIENLEDVGDVRALFSALA